jgi:hypothetical protein
MTRTLCLAGLAALFTLPTAGQPPKSKDKEKAPAPAETARQIAADLKEARGLLKGVSDKKTRERLELLIGRAELAAGDLRQQLAGREKAKPGGMTAEDFAKVLKGIKGQSFDDGKVGFVKGLGKTVRFSSAQVKQLLATFSFDAGRTEAAVLLYPMVADPEFFFEALEAFSFESSRKAVRERLGIK